MNNIKAEYNLDTYSVQIKMHIEVAPNLGVDANGTYQRTSWAGCAQALAIFLDGIEASKDTVIEVIEGELTGNGNTNNGDDSED